MDIHFQHRGTTFVWNDAKASGNLTKHGVGFEEAVTVFDDPLLVVQDASRNDESRDAVIGFDTIRGCCSWCMSSFMTMISPRHAERGGDLCSMTH